MEVLPVEYQRWLCCTKQLANRLNGEKKIYSTSFADKEAKDVFLSTVSDFKQMFIDPSCIYFKLKTVQL